MKSILKTLSSFVLVQSLLIAGYGQQPVKILPPGVYEENVLRAPGVYDEPGNDQVLADAKKNADGAKILILGNSYPLDANAWLSLGKMTFKEQTESLKGMLYTDAKMRKSVINDASFEVLGSSAEAVDFAYWDAKIIKEKKDGYGTIVSANISKLNADKNNRELMIRVAHVTVFGREATAAELGKWMSSTAHYRIIYQSLIAYLYSPEGAAELAAIVKKTFTNNNLKYTDEQVIQRMMIAKAQKMDFMKMASYF